MEIIRTKVTKENSNSSWSEIAEAIRVGRAKEIISVGDRLTVNHSDYGMLEFDVLDFDRDTPADLELEMCHTVTLQLHDLVLPEMPFDEDNRNSWKYSSIREWLNGPDFVCGFDPEFVSLITPVSKVTNQKSEKEEHTEDSFFLLSKEETITNDCYAYYKNARNMVKFNPNSSNETDWWWLRSALRYSASGAWYVSGSGYVSYSYAYDTFRCAPACVIC